MNDNRHPAERAAFLANVGANGRWFILSLVAIALATDQGLAACAASAILGASVIVEQVRGSFAMLARLGVYAWSAILLIWVSVGAAL